MKFFSGIGVAVSALVLAVFLIVGGSFASLYHYKFLAPKFQAVDREVFENTPSYVQGKEQYLGRLRREYDEADTSAQKKSLRELILSEASTVDREQLSSSLQKFLSKLDHNN